MFEQSRKYIKEGFCEILLSLLVLSAKKKKSKCYTGRTAGLWTICSLQWDLWNKRGRPLFHCSFQWSHLKLLISVDFYCLGMWGVGGWGCLFLNLVNHPKITCAKWAATVYKSCKYMKDFSALRKPTPYKEDYGEEWGNLISCFSVWTILLTIAVSKQLYIVYGCGFDMHVRLH